MKYTLPCGREFEANTNCYAVGFGIAHCLTPESSDIEPVQTKISFFDECQNCDKGKKLSHAGTYSAVTKNGDPTSCPGHDTFCLGYSTEYLHYHGMAIPDSFPEPCSNFQQSYTVEVTAQCDEYRAVIYFHSENSEGVSMLEYIDSFLEDDLMDHYYDAEADCISIPMTELDTGRFSSIEFENVDDFKAAIISIRMIDYSDQSQEE